MKESHRVPTVSGIDFSAALSSWSRCFHGHTSRKQELTTKPPWKKCSKAPLYGKISTCNPLRSTCIAWNFCTTIFLLRALHFETNEVCMSDRMTFPRWSSHQCSQWVGGLRGTLDFWTSWSSPGLKNMVDLD
jgi:hypothetical protein